MASRKAAFIIGVAMVMLSIGRGFTESGVSHWCYHGNGPFTHAQWPSCLLYMATLPQSSHYRAIYTASNSLSYDLAGFMVGNQYNNQEANYSSSILGPTIKKRQRYI